MADSYITPFGEGRGEHIQMRSRFIGQVMPVADEQQAIVFIKKMKSEHHDARHNPYAYIAGGVTRMSDDGEPQGTGGMPILEVFKREGVTDFCCVVTRYFGGVLLGAPGLTRAYAKAAKLGLETAGKARMRAHTQFYIALEYRLLDQARAIINQFGARETDAQYGKDARLTAHIAKERYDALRDALTAMSAGTIKPAIIGEKYMGEKIL